MKLALLISFLFSYLAYTQEEKVSQKIKLDNIDIHAKKKQREIPLDVEIIDSEESDEESDEQWSEEQELPLKAPPTSKLPPPKIEEEFEDFSTEEPIDKKVESSHKKEPVIERTSSFDFIFDNSKPALFQTKLKRKSLLIGLGLASFEKGDYQKTGDGGKTKREWRIPVFKIALNFEGEKFAVSPGVSFSLPKKSEDELMKKSYVNLGLKASLRVSEVFKLNLGSSVLMTIIKGIKTDTVTLKDKQGVFFLNKKSKIALMNTLDFGAQLELGRVEPELRISTLSLFDKDKRDFSFGLFFNYRFDFKKKPSLKVKLKEGES